MITNYTKSYTNGASEFSAECALWPNQFDDTMIDAQSIQDYANEKYFKTK